MKHLFNVSDIRVITTEIERERKNGYPILSTCNDGGGYFLPANKEEAEQFRNKMHNRAQEIMLSANCVNEYLKCTSKESRYDKG